MMQNVYLIVGGFLLLWVVGCSSSQVVVNEPTENVVATEEVATQPEEDNEIYVPEDDPMSEDYIEERILPELQVTAPRGYVLEPLNSAADRLWDLHHMDLYIRFDWPNEHVIGVAKLELSPYFYDQEQLVLDAKGFDINSITGDNGRPYTFTYDGLKLAIDLPRTYVKDEKLELEIDYIAKPSEGPEGGSMAITSDKGLFFINPRGEEGNKSKQIWTQGETEHNSRWFPTIDKPNENLTHTITMTVAEEYVTLSNGTLTTSVVNKRWNENRPMGNDQTTCTLPGHGGCGRICCCA